MTLVWPTKLKAQMEEFKMSEICHKFTITIGATVTTQAGYASLVAAMDEAARGLGSSVVVTLCSASEWVDQSTMQPQEFNPDGTPYVPEPEPEPEPEPVE